MSKPPKSADSRTAPAWPAALAELGRRLGDVEDVETATHVLADAVRTTLEPDRLLIVLAEPGSHTPKVAHAFQYPDARPDDPYIRHAVTHGPCVLPHLTPRVAAQLALPTDRAVGSWVAAPIPEGEDGTLGAVSAVTKRANRYDRDHLGFLAGAAALYAAALEHRRRLDVLSRGKREWEALVDAVGEAFCVIDPAGRVVRANRPFCDMAGVAVTEVAGTPWRDLVPADWHDSILRALEAPGRARVAEVARGSRSYALTALRLPTPGGAALSFVDQTERRRLEEQLIQSAKLTAIGQLIAGVAHDLNNPLASVVGFADFLVEEADPPLAMREPLLAIRQEAERAAAIVRNLLQFARRQEQDRRVQPIGDILAATLQLLQNQLTGWQIDVELGIDDDLPDVAVNRNQVQQVFVNVLTNAAQAIHGSGSGSRIVVAAKRWLDGIAVTIEDDGPGVPQAIRERVFEPFFTTKQEEGTGLGLSISQGILKEHGGRLSYGSSTLGGAAFRIEIPGSTAPAPPLEETAPDVAPLRILVVDDEPHIQHYLLATLEAWGHTVRVASDGAEALQLLEHTAFDAIITDLRMPNVGGRAFFEALQQDRPDAARRVVFATGDTVGDDAQAFLETAGRPLLRKPFTQRELRAALAAVAG